VTGTAVAPKGVQTNIVIPTLNNMSYDAGERWYDSKPKGEFVRPFAGTEIRFNGQDGEYLAVIPPKEGKTKWTEKALGTGLELTWIANQTVEAWQYWPEEMERLDRDTGEMVTMPGAPSYPYMIPVFADAPVQLPSRDNIPGGDEMKEGIDDKMVFVWQEVIVLFFRDEDGRIFHMIMNGSKRTAAIDFIGEAIQQGRQNHGLYPVVVLDQEKKEFTPKGKKSAVKFRAPTFEITEWEEPLESDSESLVVMQGTHEAVNADEVAEAKRAKKAKPEPQEEDESLAEDVEPEEEAPKPRRRKAASKDKSEEEAPKRRRKSAATKDESEDEAPKRRKAKAAEEEDEGEEDEKPVRARRRIDL
jgi:hypothetical protein